MRLSLRIKSKNVEYQFFIPGKAYSFRSDKKRTYQKHVVKCAKKFFKKPLGCTSIEVAFYYFHTPKGRRMDVDNIAKCIMDAFNGVVYLDDRFVHSQKIRTFNTSKAFTIYDEPLDIIKPLKTNEEYVAVRILEKNVYELDRKLS